MRKVSKIFLFLAVTLGIFALAGCASGLEADNFTSYNNAVISLFEKYADQTDKLLANVDKENDPQKFISMFEQARKDAENYQKAAKEIPVPKGSEKLSEAINQLFDTQVKGLDTLLSTLKKIQDGSIPNTDMTPAVEKYEKDYDASVENFEKVQKDLAAQYDVRIE